MLSLRLCLGVLLLAATPATAAEIRPASTIQSVVVYPVGATVVRTATVELPAGATVVVIDDLPIGVEADSLKIDGSATSAFAIASVETRYVPADEFEDPAREVLLDAMQAISDELAAIDDRIGALDGRRRFLERLIEATPQGFGEALKDGGLIEQWGTAAAAIGEGLAEVADATRAAHLEQRALNERLAERQKELAELPQPADHIGVRIALFADTATTGRLSISYRTPAANWIPTYDAQLSTGEDSGKPSLAIVRRAEVTQATGEDWSDIALTLSTTQTAGGTAAPFLAANLVTLFDGSDAYGQAADTSTALARPPPAPGLSDALAANEPASQAEVAKYIEAAANFGDFRAEYTVPGRVSVESGEGARSMRIATEHVTARVEVRAVPMLSATAYLHAAFVPRDGAPMLPGKVALYRDGTFVGNGDLPFGRSGRELNLGFGVDDRVRVTRVALERETGEHGILSSRKTDTRRFKITVDNLHNQAMEITMLDRVPYAEDETVTVVRLGDTSEPTAVDVDDRRGVLAWTHTYQPGESRELLNGYEVSWPADQQVVSLE